MSIFQARDALFRETETLVKLKRKLSPLVVKDREIIPKAVEESDEVSLKRWVAVKLAEEGIAEIIEPPVKDKSYIYKIYLSERASKVPAKLDPNFYPYVREYLRLLKSRAERTKDPSLLREYESVLEKLNRMVKIRLKKLVSELLLLDEIPREIRERMTEEEAYLVDQLRSTLKEWIRDLFDI